MEEAGDLTSVVLRGHLILEELLVAAISTHCSNPAQLKNARLRFEQLVVLLKALDESLLEPHMWSLLFRLNSFRNKIAHQLEPGDLAQELASIINAALSQLESNEEGELVDGKEAEDLGNDGGIDEEAANPSWPRDDLRRDEIVPREKLI